MYAYVYILHILFRPLPGVPFFLMPHMHICMHAMCKHATLLFRSWRWRGSQLTLSGLNPIGPPTADGEEGWEERYYSACGEGGGHLRVEQYRPFEWGWCTVGLCSPCLWWLVRLSAGSGTCAARHLCPRCPVVARCRLSVVLVRKPIVGLAVCGGNRCGAIVMMLRKSSFLVCSLAPFETPFVRCVL